MSKALTTFSVTAPGYYGLNTQDSPVDLDQKFALEATNCVIDKSGRVASRKGWVKQHSANTDLGTSSIMCIGECVAANGDRTIVAAGSGYLFKLSGSTLTTLTYGGGGVAPTITADNWQFVTFNGAGLFFQSGHDPLVYDPTLSTTTFRRISEHPSYAGTVPQGNAALSAFGRVWVAATSSDKNTITWSDTLTYQVWTGGAAGTLNLQGVWPQGGDEVVALAQHNNNLIIFGTKQFLIYSGADDPSTMVLADSVSSTGCAARDTVQNTGSDLIFLSDSGLRSLQRTIQEKSAPLSTISRNVNDDILAYLASEPDSTSIKAIYSSFDAFYLLTFTHSAACYCFDLRSKLADGSARASVWISIRPYSFCYSKTRTLYLGRPGYVAAYDGYYDDIATYRIAYYTAWLDFGNPVQKSILKKISMVLFGTLNQSVVYKWGFDYTSGSQAQPSVISDTNTPSEYNIAEYGVGEYNRNLIVKQLNVNAGGSGRVIQVGFEAQVQGYPISIQRVDVYTKEGRI